MWRPETPRQKDVRPFVDLQVQVVFAYFDAVENWEP